MDNKTLSVGFVAKRCGVNVSTLHFYEQKGLIQSWRNAGNQRQYKADVLRRVAVIKAAQKLGVSLQEIKLTLATLPKERTPDKADWAKLSKTWQAALDTRIQQLTKLRDSLTGCIGCGCLSLKSCPIYNPQDQLADQGPGPVILDR
ncbi:redox-sensitive transcriptional activator SoxR [Aliiglaciecola litoralis]|uniref:Redox-sensitive transcriptional activator SoxR n=1 Tax=Aliiglaciecola litoralis TaxID=582857 RepID=A0ABN1LS77_9ALTE